MKRIFFISALLMTLALTSCKDKGTYSSPSITFGHILINGVEPAESVMYVGDTLKISMALNSYYNVITNFNVTTDRSFLKDSIFSDADFATLCNAVASDRSQGRYVFNTFEKGTTVVINNASFVALLSPNSEDKSVTLQFDVKNDSPLDGDYNPVSYKFKFKILEKETSGEEDSK